MNFYCRFKTLNGGTQCDELWKLREISNGALKLSSKKREHGINTADLCWIIMTGEVGIPFCRLLKSFEHKIGPFEGFFSCFAPKVSLLATPNRSVLISRKNGFVPLFRRDNRNQIKNLYSIKVETERDKMERWGRFVSPSSGEVK